MQISVLEYLEKQSMVLPNKIAYQDDNETMSFSNLLQESKRIGSALCENIHGKNPVVVISGKTVHAPSMFFGVVYAGGFYVPLTPEMPIARLKLILEIVKPDLILVDEKGSALVKEAEITAKILTYNEIKDASVNERVLETKRRAATDCDPLYLLCTSGSTGKPKGVVVSHKAMIVYIESLRELTGICEMDVLANQITFDVNSSVRDLYFPLCAGAKSVFLRRDLDYISNHIFKKMDECGVTTIAWPVSLFVRCSELDLFRQASLNSVRRIMFSGASMPGKHLRYWQDNLPHAQFINLYGSTETVASNMYYFVDHPVEDDEVLPIGFPMSNIEILLLDGDKQVKEEEMGEICVRGSTLSMGYYGDQEKTDADFVRNPLRPGLNELIYRTGDYGIRRLDGVMMFHGRKDFQIKYLGYRIELGEIERVANGITGVDKCICLFRAKPECIFLFYTGSLEKRGLTVSLRELLPRQMMPGKIVKLNAMPVLHNGKTDLTELKRMME